MGFFIFFYFAFLRALIPMVMESTPEVLPPPFFLRLFFLPYSPLFYYNSRYVYYYHIY